jgi:O-antigen/teichoic acid export membrane protein
LAGLVLLGAVVLMLVLFAPLMVPSALGGHASFLVALVVGSVTSSLVYLARGLLGGERHFSGYAATLAGEGLARLLPCLAVALAGGADATAYALLFAIGSGLGAAAGLPWLRRADRRRSTEIGNGTEPASIASPTVAGVVQAVAVLAGSTLLAQLVANLAPVVVSARLPTDTATTAAFAAAFVLVRIPLLLSAPVTAMLLPTLTANATRGDVAGLRRVLRVALAALGGLGAAGVLASFAAGSWAVRVLRCSRAATRNHAGSTGGGNGDTPVTKPIMRISRIG